MADGKPENRTIARSIRFTPVELAEIQRMAEQRFMDFSSYVRMAAMGRLGDPGGDLEDWQTELARVRQRLQRLEELAFGQ